MRIYIVLKLGESYKAILSLLPYKAVQRSPHNHIREASSPRTMTNGVMQTQVDASYKLSRACEYAVKIASA